MFIDFEGIDGCGKSIISEMLLTKLNSLGLTAEHTRANGKWQSELSREIRSATKDPYNLDMNNISELFLYTARDAQLIEKFIKPALKRKSIVIADRYLYSYYALSFFGRGLKYDDVDSVCKMAADGLWPDLVICIDTSVETSVWRKKISKINENHLGKFGRKGLSGLGLRKKMRDGFLEMAGKDTKKWVVIDNDGASLHEVFDQVWDIVKSKLEQKGILVKNKKAVTKKKNEYSNINKDLLKAKAQEILSIKDSESRIKILEEHFYSYMNQLSDWDPDQAALLLSGMDSAKDYELREKLFHTSNKIITLGLKGLNSSLSYAFRKKTEILEPKYTALSLLGIKSEEAQVLRDQLIKISPKEVLQSLLGLDTMPANKLRERYLKKHANSVLSGLGNVDSKVAWKLREKVDESVYQAALALSLLGLDSERAWTLRDKLKEKELPWILISLSRLQNEQAWVLRKKYLHKATKIIIQGINGIDHPLAWEMRQDRLMWATDVLDSIRGMDNDHAWIIREKAFGHWDYGIIKSLAGINTDQAWNMRWELYKKNPDDLQIIKQIVKANYTKDSLPSSNIKMKIWKVI